MSNAPSSTNTSSIYAVSEKQQAEIARLKWVKNIDIAPVPEQHRYEFVNTMVKQNFERMVIASKFGSMVIAALIIAVDVLNLPDLPQESRSFALYTHIALFFTLTCGYAAGIRLNINNPNISLAAFFVWGNFFRGSYTVAAYLMFYNMGASLDNISGAYAVFVGLISAGLYANKSYTIILGLVNAAVYTGIVLATSQSLRTTSNELFCGYAVLAIAVFSANLLFQGFRQEFAMTKQMQDERNKAEELNTQLVGANEEVSRQMELLSEQAREIEISNTALQEKTIELEQERSTLENLNSALNIEQHKSEELLHNILPRAIAHRLKSGEENIANHFENVTVLFADIVGFTQLSASRPAWDVVSLLNRVFSAFDIFSEQYNLEKIKTIGDAYMIVGGLPEARDDHAETVARMALEMLATVELLSKTLDAPIALRIGIHSGAVVAGVIGKKKFAYDLWGDTVNTASRMESHGEAGKIHVSEDVYALLQEKFLFEKREEIEVKGKGMMQTWFLVGAK
jgi:class 3 adenylate cyclase